MNTPWVSRVLVRVFARACAKFAGLGAAPRDDETPSPPAGPLASRVEAYLRPLVAGASDGSSPHGG